MVKRTLTVETNIPEINKRMDKRVKIARQKVARMIAQSVSMVRTSAVDGIQGGPKTGRIYKRRSTSHQASSPGQYPASDTGNLASNISIKVKRRGNEYIGRVTSSADYSKHLEYGTMNIFARPFMQPSLEKNRRKIVNKFKKAGLLRKLS